MTDYIAPSKKFARNPEPVNMFAAPRNPVTSTSSGMTSSDSGIAYVQPKPATTRPGSTAKTDAQVAAEKKAVSDTAYLGAASAGLANSAVPATTDTTANTVSVLGNVASGAASGAMAGSIAGGPGALAGGLVGGGIALVTSGLSAWVGNRQARADRDRQNAINAANRRAAAQERDDLEKWKTVNQLNTIEAAKEDRRRYNQNAAREGMKAAAENMNNILATSASAKAQWAKFGF